MGIKRINRSRLYNIEKEGKDVADSIGVSDAMRKAIISATQHRLGQQLVTDIVLDLGAGSAGLKSMGIAAADPIGTTASSDYPSHVCRVAESVFGVVTAVETVCLEISSDGTLTDYDVLYATGSASTGFLGTDADADSPFPATALADVGSAVGKHLTSAIDNNRLSANSGLYVYIAAGAASGQRASATITLTDATVTNIVSGMSAIQLLDEDGSTKAQFVFNDTKGWDQAAGAAVNGVYPIHMGGTSATPVAASEFDNVYKLTQAISVAIDAYDSAAHFDTDTASKTAGAGTSVSTITVTRNNTAPLTTENTTSTLVDGYSASGIVVSDFSGGIPATGQAMTAGKLLIRFTGYVEPDDIV